MPGGARAHARGGERDGSGAAMVCPRMHARASPRRGAAPSRGARAIIGVAFDARGDRAATAAATTGTPSRSAWDTARGARQSSAGRASDACSVGAVVPDHPRGPGRALPVPRTRPARDLRRTHVRFWKPAPRNESAPKSAEVKRRRFRARACASAPGKPAAEDVCSGAFVDWCAVLEGPDALRARGGVHAIPH